MFWRKLQSLVRDGNAGTGCPGHVVRVSGCSWAGFDTCQTLVSEGALRSGLILFLFLLFLTFTEAQKITIKVSHSPFSFLYVLTMSVHFYFYTFLLWLSEPRDL